MLTHVNKLVFTLYVMESLIDLERSRPAKASVKSCIFLCKSWQKIVLSFNVNLFIQS